MARPDNTNVPAAFAPHLLPGEQLKFYCYGVKQPNILLIVVLMLLALLPAPPLAFAASAIASVSVGDLPPAASALRSHRPSASASDNVALLARGCAPTTSLKQRPSNHHGRCEQVTVSSRQHAG